MPEWRLLGSDGVSAAAGLALDEALMSSYAHGEPDRSPTLRLYTYASHCVLVGRYQDARAEVDLEACERTGTAIGRRPTGGGAIVMGAGQAGVALVDRVHGAARPKEMLERYAEGIVRGLATLGVDATFRGKNDLECAGRKIAGLGLYLDGRGALLFHSSVLAGLDIAFMLEVLRIPAAKLGDKAVAAVSERVTTVSRETGREWCGATLRDAIARGFADAFGVAMAPAEAGPEEIALADELERTKYLTPDWIFQRSPQADARGSAVFKTPAGLVRVYLALKGGAVKSVLFTGDFNELPEELVKLESALRWTRIERVHDVVTLECPRGALGVDAGSLAGAVRAAAGRAAEREEVAVPDRDGSCYFPEVV